MKYNFWAFLLLFGCYQPPLIKGFDKSLWNEELSCTHDRIDQANTLVENSGRLVKSNQNEITNLLGDPDEHELYSRNEKFFYYELSLACDSVVARRLSIRFDALGRLKEIAIIQTE